MRSTDRGVVTDVAYFTALAATRAALLDESGEPLLELELHAPTDHRVADGWETFTVALTGPAELRLPQATYRVRFADGHDDWLFLVPSAGDADRSTYLSTFNREHP